VVDGRFGFVGSDGREAVSAIQKAIREPKIAIAIANVTRAHVTRGENGGRNLVRVGVVRGLKQAATVDLDTAFAKDVALSVAPGIGSNGLRLVAFIRDPRSGRVLGVVDSLFRLIGTGEDNDRRGQTRNEHPGDANHKSASVSWSGIRDKASMGYS
jgi:hypothetical protein